MADADLLLRVDRLERQLRTLEALVAALAASIPDAELVVCERMVRERGSPPLYWTGKWAGSVPVDTANPAHAARLPRIYVEKQRRDHRALLAYEMRALLPDGAGG